MCGERGLKNKQTEKKQGWVDTAGCQGQGQSTQALRLGGNRSAHGRNTENSAVFLKENCL